MTEAKRGTWRVWLGIGLIFLFGAITGILGAAFWVHHVVGFAHSRGPGAIEDVALELLDWRLDLDREQEAEIAEILREMHIDLMAFRTRHGGELDSLMESGLERIAATLDDEQREEWVSLRERIRAHHWNE